MDIPGAYEIAKKWIPSLNDKNKKKMMDYINSENIPCIGLINDYIKIIREHGDISKYFNQENGDACVSGFIFFYFCIIYIFCNEKSYIDHKDDIVLYNILYILVDNHIDDNTISQESKQNSIDQMYKLLNDPNKLDYISDEKIKLIANTYNKLLLRVPTIKNRLIDLFQAEIDGLYIQSLNTHSLETYKNICYIKGGLTMMVLHTVVSTDDSPENTYDLGIVIQLVDDLVDVNFDRDKKINTIATHMLEKNLNLDELWIDTMYQIDNLDIKYTIFKIICSTIMAYCVVRNKNNFSNDLYKIVSEINIFKSKDDIPFDFSKFLSNIILKKI